MGESRFLVVDDEAVVRRALTWLLRAHGRVVGAGTVREGTALLADRGHWSAFFIDLGLPDGSGLDVLAYARTIYARTPAMVLTGSTEAVHINAANDLHAHYVVKPVAAERINRFLSDTTSVASRLEAVLGGWVSRYYLSDAEADVLRRAALGESKGAIASARGSSELTVKRHVVNLLRRTRDASMHAAVERLLREVAII